MHTPGGSHGQGHARIRRNVARRIYLYRLPGDPGIEPEIHLNGRNVGHPARGTVLFVDQLAGRQEAAWDYPNPALVAHQRLAAPFACLFMWPGNAISRSINGRALPGLELPCDNDQIKKSVVFDLKPGEVVYLRFWGTWRNVWGEVQTAEQARKEIEEMQSSGQKP